MKYDEHYELLVEYAEGTLSAERKTEVEIMLKQSPALLRELEIIQSAFQGLQNAPDEEVPKHYFTNFLPRLRQRIDSGENYSRWFVPQWIQSVLAPTMAAVIVISIVSVYQSFKPEVIQSSIYSLVNQLEQNEISSIVDDVSNFESTTGIIRSAETIVTNLSNSDAVNSKLNEELLSTDMLTYQTDSELIDQLEDQEIEQALERLAKPSIQ